MKKTVINGRLGVRIVLFTLADGTKVVGATAINNKDGERIIEGYWKPDTIRKKINHYSKELGVPEYNHETHFPLKV